MNTLKKEVGTALLKVKCINYSINPESITFEEYICSPNTSIKIDLFDGKSWFEKSFSAYKKPLKKYYIEFFDYYPVDNLMGYLTNTNNDFRVTSLDGTIIRMCKNDYLMISLKKGKKEKPLKEFVFVEK